ncbi:ABC transporter permease [Methylocella sp.]|uniref:ABC transporter permease n=1 Tax=Methylocella sp. TaxID=1978226 RepID=UPI0035B48CC1
MKRLSTPGALAVATREIRWIARDRVALFLIFGVPLIAFGLLAATFRDAVIRDLRVSVVDADRTAISRVYVQAIASAPSVTVAERSGDLTGAMHAIRSGAAIAAVYIPPDFEHDFLARKHPQIVVFYNRQFFTPGNNAASALAKAIDAATATLPPPPAAGAGYRPGRLVVEQYVLTNPALNFAQFLLRAVLPTVLHVVVAVAAGYSVGSEFSARSRKAWLRAAGGSPLAALLGKLAPLFGVFVMMMVVVAVIIHGLYGIPFRGDSVMMGAAACLLVIAYLSIGALLQLLVRKLAVGLSLTAVFCSPAFGFAGVGFPLFGMNGFALFWGSLLPLRWYVQILFDQAARGLPTYVSAEPFAILGAIATAAFGLAWLRLRAIAGRPSRAAPAAPREPAFDPRGGVGGAMFAEWRRILNDSGAFALIVLSPLLYGFFYPQPYLGEVLRRIPVAVVDQDGTELSREIVATLDADEAVTVAARATTMTQAHALLARREVFAILAIPEGAQRDVLKGDRARIAAYVDSAYFLLYNRTLQGFSEAVATVGGRIATGGARDDGSLAYAAAARRAPVEVVSQPLFNPTGGYASYVVPAAFVLILQQTLLMGVASLGGLAFERAGSDGRSRRGGARAILGQGLAHLCLATPGVALYLIVLPRVYGFSTLGKPLDLLLFSAPFLLAVSFLAQFAGQWFRRRESAVLLFVATSLPLFFTVGVSWPQEAIPEGIRLASRLMPSTSAIDGLVRINQMGADLHDVSRDFMTLWALAGLYGVLAAATSRILGGERLRHAQ